MGFGNREIYDNGYGNATQQLNLETRERSYHAPIRNLRIVTPSDLLSETKESYNSFFLASGDYGGQLFKKEYTRVIGTGESVFNNQVICDRDSIVVFDNCIFESRMSEGSRTNNNILVEVRGGAKVVFSNCVFRKSTNDRADDDSYDYNWVYVLEDGKASFNGCIFSGGSAQSNVGFVVMSHANNALTDVQLTAGINATNQTNVDSTSSGHYNVTVISEMT